MKRVLVTGASGCIGRQAVPRLLRDGWEVHAASRGRALAATPDVIEHAVDLLDPAASRALVDRVRPDALLHLAWYVAPGRWATHPSNLDWVAASLELVRRAHEAGAQRVVVSGSGLEYDWQYGYCVEDQTPCQPHTLYGVAKHALRLLLEGYATHAGLSLAWARVFFLFGPHEHPGSARRVGHPGAVARRARADLAWPAGARLPVRGRRRRGARAAGGAA